MNAPPRYVLRIASLQRAEILEMTPAAVQMHLEAHGFDFSSSAPPLAIDEDTSSGHIAYAQAVLHKTPEPLPPKGRLDLSALREYLRRGYR